MTRKSQKPNSINAIAIEKLIDFVESEAFCACCEGVRKCLPGCTLKQDCSFTGISIDGYDRLVRARKALLAYDALRANENGTAQTPD